LCKELPGLLISRHNMPCAEKRHHAAWRWWTSDLRMKTAVGLGHQWCMAKTRCPYVNHIHVSGCVIASRFLNLRTTWGDKATLLADKIPRYSLNRRLRGPQSRSGLFWREKPLLFEWRHDPPYRSSSLYPNRHSDYAIPALCIGWKCCVSATTVSCNQTRYADYSSS
jgi:hypothetical protein